MTAQTKSRRKSYGKTWWGQTFIEAMEQGADARLKRGKTYANTGKVYEFQIKDTQIKAKVYGSYRPYYKVELNLKEFSSKEKEDFKELITNYPRLGIELARARLAPDILELCQRKNINLFPKSWREIEADCSCPDWGDPCKHQAATYYMLTNEIDKDPLLLLKLRGIDPSELAVNEGSMLQVQEINKLVDIDQQFTKDNKEIYSDKLDYNQELRNIISWTPNKRINVINLLDANPPFYSEGDFCSVLAAAYDSIMISAFKFKFSTIEENDKLRFKNITMNFDSNADSYLSAWSMATEDSSDKNMRLLLQLLATKLNSKLDTMTDSFRFLFLASHLSLKLLLEGLFVPEVLGSDDKSFDIKFSPLIINDELQLALNSLKKFYPANLCTNQEGLVLNEIEEILSYLITTIIIYLASESQNIERSKLLDVFFLALSFKQEHYSEENLAYSLSNWLEKLQLRKSTISPVINFTDTSAGFRLSASFIDKREPLAPLIAYSNLVKSQDQDLIKEAKRELNIASDYLTELREIIDSNGSFEPEITLDQMLPILTESKSVLEFLGIKISVPKELVNILKPKIKAKVSPASKISLLNMADLLDFSYEIAIGDQSLSAKEFKELVRNAKGLVKYKDQYLFLSPEEISKILTKLEAEPSKPRSNHEAMLSILSGQIAGVDLIEDANLEKFYKVIAKEERVSIPKELKATLRPYQERGFKWLYSNLKKNFGSCIADDMGLGKTIQVITLILKMKREKSFKPALIVCPTALVGNWFKECEKFAPSLKAHIYHGSKRELKDDDYDLLITSYGTFRRDCKRFNEKEWGLMVIDEAQNIKNTETKQAQAIKSINAKHFISMTGTPVENRLSELWSILDYSNRGLLGSLKDFRNQYADPIEKYKDEDAINRLRRVTAPFLLRRLKIDKTIIQDLPDKIVEDDYCNLSKEQAAIYESITEGLLEDIEGSEGIERKGLIFKLITALKQVCNHPCNYLKKGVPDSEHSGKSTRLLSLLKDILASNEKVLIFTQYKEMGDLLVEMIHKELKEESLFFHGGVSRKSRDVMVEEFQNNLANRIMIISLKAGGVGLNLTAANHVIHYDLWWNPAVENQATDRAFRIGQKRNVMVHRFITLGTFEEKVDEIIKSKQELADLTVSSGEQWINKLSNKELREIFSL